MTLKELRISKGMSQAACAEYLGMSTRNYQNYENDAKKAQTAKYHAIYQKLDVYGQTAPTAAQPEFHTRVVTGAALQAMIRSVAKYSKRDCYRTLEKFVKGDYDGKICILYGLRRTGKTTLLFQMLADLPLEQAAYPIEVKSSARYSIESLKRFKEKYKSRIGGCYIIHPRNLIKKNDILCIPSYMTICM